MAAPPFTFNIFTVCHSRYRDGLITPLPDRRSSTSQGLLIDVLCLVFGSISMSLSISLSLSVLPKFEFIFMRWRLFLQITLFWSINNVWD